MLATLFKDERCSQLSSQSILEKMYLDRSIRKPELQELESLLQPHHKATTADGSTLLDRAVVEHKGVGNSGHYVTFRRGPSDSRSEHRWYVASDSEVSEVDFATVAASEGYMFFYEKEKAVRRALDVDEV